MSMVFGKFRKVKKTLDFMEYSWYTVNNKRSFHVLKKHETLCASFVERERRWCRRSRFLFCQRIVVESRRVNSGGFLASMVWFSWIEERWARHGKGRKGLWRWGAGREELFVGNPGPGIRADLVHGTLRMGFLGSLTELVSWKLLMKKSSRGASSVRFWKILPKYSVNEKIQSWSQIPVV